MAVAQPSMNGGRTDFLDDEDYFMAVAFLAAQRSRDPSSQVGACIVNEDGKVVGIGYNCMPNGCEGNKLMSWARTGDSKLDTKYPYVCHAELNAIMNKFSADVKGCTIYVALFPCNECSKIIIQSGLQKVVYYSDKYHDTPETIASERMLKKAGITVVSFKAKSKKTQIAIDFNSIDPPKTGETVTAEQSKETDEN